MRFDWYQCTISAPSKDVFHSIAALGDSLEKSDSLARVYRGDSGYRVMRDGRSIATLVMGGQYGSDRVHAWATSDDTDSFVDVVRNEWPEAHQVTRADAAEDFVEGSSKGVIVDAMLNLARRNRRMYCEHVTKPTDEEGGQTLYLGSKTSDYRCRWYEKGFEQLGKINSASNMMGVIFHGRSVQMTTPDGKSVNASDWSRLELQARPKGDEARYAASQASPEELWTFSKWTKQLAEEVLGLSLARAYLRSHKVSGDEEKVYWLTRQYGGFLVRLAAEMGDAEAMRYIRDTHAQIERLNRR